MAVLTRAMTVMSMRHYELLLLVFSLERLLLSKQATSLEVSMFVNGIDFGYHDEDISRVEVPAWMELQVSDQVLTFFNNCFQILEYLCA